MLQDRMLPIYYVKNVCHTRKLGWNDQLSIAVWNTLKTLKPLPPLLASFRRH